MTVLLMDGNLTDALADALPRLDPELAVRWVGDGIALPLGAADPDLLLWSEERDSVMVSDNRRALPVHLAAHLTAGRHISGIIQIPKDLSLGTLADAAELVLGATLRGELVGRITYLAGWMS